MLGRLLRHAVVIGVVAGIAVWHVALVGMVDAFQRRPIVTGYVSLGELLPFLVAAVAGFWASAPPRDPGIARRPPAATLLAGATGGATVGAMMALLAFFIILLRPNDMLIHATPVLAKDLRFGLDGGPALTVELLGTGAVGLVAAALRLTPRTGTRTALWAIGTVLLAGTMKNFVSQILTNLPFAAVSRFLYQGDGLSVPGAIALFVAAALVAGLWTARGRTVRATYRMMPRGRQQTTKIILFAILGVVVLVLPPVLGPFLADVITTVGLFIMLGLGLNIVVGFAGLLDLGYVAFYALGAYAMAVLTSPLSPAFHPELNFWVALPIVMLIGGLIGLIIGAPVLRLRGDYLAIVTLGFGEIARIIFLSEWMTPYVGGANGIQGIPAPEILGVKFRDAQLVYYPMLVAIILAALVAWSFYNSRVGRAWTAMREDETVAEATGVNTTVYKLMAFAMGAVFGSLAGAFYAAKIGVVFPQNLDILISINALSLIILGGMGSIAGVVLGAFVLVGLPGLLREFAEYQLLIFGAVLVAMMLFRPEGLIPNRSRRAELHESDEETPEGEAGPPGQAHAPRSPTLATESGAISTHPGGGG